MLKRVSQIFAAGVLMMMILPSKNFAFFSFTESKMYSAQEERPPGDYLVPAGPQSQSFTPGYSEAGTRITSSVTEHGDNINTVVTPSGQRATEKYFEWDGQSCQTNYDSNGQVTYVTPGCPE